ncbi:MAG: hypothetical protein NE330_10630, partial [Lentisphaeraceae bacterium]|nr:hypothetical protein [Lentisphaeraceae bacterium]
MNNSQFKILTGFMATIAVLAAALLFVVNKKDSDKVATEQNQRNIITAKATTKQEVTKAASTKDIDDFFKTVEAKQEEKPKVVVAKKTSKNKFDKPHLLQVSKLKGQYPSTTDWMYDGQLFKLSYTELRTKFSRLSEYTEQRKLAYTSKLFPEAFKSTINYNKREGLVNFSHDLKPLQEAQTKESWLRLKKAAIKKVSTVFGGTFTAETRSNGSEINKALLSNGLIVHSYFHPPKTYSANPKGRLIISFSDSFNKINEPDTPIPPTDQDLRTFANYLEMYKNFTIEEFDTQKFFMRVHSKINSQNIYQRNGIKKFYSTIDKSSLFSVQITDLGFPKVTDLKSVTTQVPNLREYLKWTAVDGKVRQIDLVSNGNTATICKMWYNSGFPLVTLLNLPGYDKNLQYIYQYSNSKLSRMLKMSTPVQDKNLLAQTLREYKILEQTFFSKNLNYTFNAKNKLIRSNFMLAGNVGFQYSDDPQHKAASHVSQTFQENDFHYNYDGPSRILRDEVKLKNLFYGTRANNYWLNLPLIAFTETPDELINISRKLVMKGQKKLLAMRNPKSTSLTLITKPKVKPVLTQKKVLPKAEAKPTTDSSSSEVLVGNDLKKFFTGDMATKVFTQVKAEDFDTKYMKPLGAVWTDDLKRSARTVKPLDFNKSTSLETLFQFKKKHLQKIVMMFYNKGDEDVITKRDFVEKLNTAKLAVKLITGTDPLFKPNAGLAKNYL